MSCVSMETIGKFNGKNTWAHHYKFLHDTRTKGYFKCLLEKHSVPAVIARVAYYV